MDHGKAKLPRRALLDKERAIAQAKNPLESNYGETLIRNNFFHRKALDKELGKISQLGRRSFMHLDQQKKRFLEKHVLPEPTIIVERPPSPAAFDDNSSMDSYFTDPGKPPHYMKPLKSRVKSASIIPTIDMFQVRQKKKVNVWERAMLEREPPQFHSRVVPSRALSPDELNDLQKGYNIQKKYGSAKRPRSFPKSIGKSTKTETVYNESPVFLTQMYRARNNEATPLETPVSPIRTLSSATLKTRKTKVVVS